MIAIWAALYTTAALLLAWSREGLLAWWLAALVVGVTAAIITYKGYGQITQRTTLKAACFFLSIGALAPIPIAWQLHRLTTEWEALRAQRDESTRSALDDQVRELLELGTATVAEVARTNGQFATAARKTAAQNARLLELQRSLFDELEAIVTRSKVDVVTVFSDSGELYAWAGDHRGKIPEEVRNGAHDVLFVERPLYSYLYFIQPHTSGHGRVAAGILLDAALPSETDQQTVRNQTRLLGGRSPFFQHGPGNAGDWSLVVGRDTVLHARLEPPSQAEWRQDLLRGAQRFQVITLLLAVLLLTIAWFREPARPGRLTAALPFYGIAFTLITAPIGGATGLTNMFSPGFFLLPGPGTVSLGTLLVVILAAGVFVSTTRPRPRFRHTLIFIVAASALAFVVPILIQVLIGPAAPPLQRWSAPSATLLESRTPLWAGLQVALVLLLAAMITGVLMIARLPAPLARAQRHRTSLLLLSTAAALAAVIAAGLLLLSRDHESVSPWIASLWLVPIIMGGFGAAAYQRDGRRLVRWLMAGWIAGTIVVPYLWVANVNSRLRSAERELLTLGSRPDPYLDFLLRGFGREAIARRERGEDDLQLLYRTWVASGLAREAYPVRLTMWDSLRNGYVQLPLGDAFTSAADRVEVMPQYLGGMFLRVQELAHPDVFAVPNADDVIQVLVVPLDQGRMVTVEVPPRRSFERANAIAPLLGSRADPSTHLDLVPAQTSTIAGGIWRRTKTGWRSEEIVPFPDTDYHAHLEVAVPRAGVLLARGTIILAADLMLLLLLWLAGRALRDEAVAPAAGWFGWLGSFRARVTAALFAFFLLPTVIFGWVAYRAVAGEVVRAARMVAERTVNQVVAEFPSQTDLDSLTQHVGAEVLIYDFQGEIQSASSLEALELGVYGAWMPADIYLELESGEEEGAVAPTTIGGQQFLTAFHTLVPRGTGTMAVPISLESGETEARQREIAHLILFAALMGGLLSLALSLAVGRALAGPIGRLQRAAAAIGAGRLNVQLPEQPGDEFGRLYASFNRMVRRLRRARGQEIRTARVLAWGEMARQVAHEIKNPLTPIKLSVQHLRRAYGDRRGDFEQTLNQSVDQILIEIDRLSEIARAFSRYGAPLVSAGPLEPVDVSSVVHEALTLYRTGDPQLSYVDDIEPGLPRVLARGGELKEVILNLLENARAATDPGGRIAVVARTDHSAIELCVQDTGGGIPEEQLAHIFEPHFSTRTAGTGLGLAIVRRLVESWGGTVDAESKTGRGTVIRVRLQAAEPAR